MPAQVLHILHGLRVLEDLKHQGPPSLRVLAESLQEATFFPSFCLGCQGPDIFYHNQRTRPVGLEYGSLMHRRGYGSVTAVLLGEAIQESQHWEVPRQELAYSVGFAMHPFLDRALHPYIISRSGSGGNAAETVAHALYHIFLERLLDAAFLEVSRDEPWMRAFLPWLGLVDPGQPAVYGFRQKEMLAEPACALAGALVPLLVRALTTAYPERAGRDKLLEQRLAHVFTDAAYFYEHTDPVTAGNRINATARGGIDASHARYLAAILYPIQVQGDVDVLNSRRDEWLHPCEGTGASHASVHQLFDEAVDAAKATLLQAWEANEQGEIATAIGTASLSTNDAEGRRCQPRHFSPLPLERLLNDQVMARWGDLNVQP
ncbi:MAG: zinc dependent phospholipase C family protein [Spirochaetales bacterium]|nr:zinc dependent phospholipase C family protein [Spirochaetales bacterium]